jgi:tetratricopeptide (TPR) repeat protein
VTSGTTSSARRQLLERYQRVRDDHLRYMKQWGLIRLEPQTTGDGTFSFEDLAVVRQADEMLAEGLSFRAVVRKLVALRSGQLAFDFRLGAQPAKVLQLTRRETLPANGPSDLRATDAATAEALFHAASLLDQGDPAHLDEVAAAYQRALVLDPDLVPAIINLANIHYARDEIAQAQALYERAIALEPDVFESYFNLGNVFHDLGRYTEAGECYREALRLNPGYADAHFYLAVTLEKNGRAQDARAHWRAYQQLAPGGEWFHLAQEFSD